MNLQLKIDDNTILHYIEDSSNHYDDEQNYVIDSYQLSFSFYDCHYYVGVSKEDIENDTNYSIELEGDSRLFNSFENLCQDELWGTIKENCAKYDVWNAELMQE